MSTPEEREATPPHQQNIQQNDSDERDEDVSEDEYDVVTK